MREASGAHGATVCPCPKSSNNGAAGRANSYRINMRQAGLRHYCATRICVKLKVLSTNCAMRLSFSPKRVDIVCNSAKYRTTLASAVKLG